MPNVPATARVTSLAQVAAQGRRTGFLGRIAQGVRYAISGVTPEVWFSPAQPLEPVAQEAKGRQFDYPVGANLFYTPRGSELTSFEQLRMLADNCDIVRLAIETRKDQLAALGWTIGNIDPRKDAPDDPTTNAVVELLKKPDGIHSWQAWLRMFVEELLVIDAPTIYHRTRKNGGHFAFEILDGASIKPLIDAFGRSPDPPSPAYQQVLKGLPTVDYTREELLYLPRNPRVHKFYGFSPVEQIILTVNIALRRSVSQLQYFTDGTVPAAFATLPPEWTPQQIEQFQAYWDTVMATQQSVHRAVLWGPGTSKMTLMRDAPLQDTFDEWLARIVCFCFSLPPTPFVKQMNRATAQQQQTSALEQGLGPYKVWVKEVMDHLVQDRLKQPALEFRWQDQTPVDPQVEATVLSTYQKTGVYCVNDVRDKLGEEPIDEDWANAYVVITATGATPLEDLIAQSKLKTEQAANPPPPVVPGVPGTPPGRPPKPQTGSGEAKPGKPAGETVAEKFAHGEDFDGAAVHEPLDARGEKLKSALVTAFGMMREDALGKLQPAEKAASDDRDAEGSHWYGDVAPAAWADNYAASVDLTPFSLVYDDAKDVLEAVAGDGSRTQVMRLAAQTPELIIELREQGIDWLNHQDPNAIKWAARRAADLIATDADGGMLVDATRNMLRSTVTQALEAKQSREELARTLKNAYAFSEPRAELIARTEIANAQTQGAYHGAVGAGMQQKRWLLSNDEGICPLCEANAAQGYIPIGKTFASGAMAPLQHPRCRCDAAYRRKPKED